MSTPAAFDGAPERGTINFSVGQPSADLLPIKLLASGGERFFADADIPPQMWGLFASIVGMLVGSFAPQLVKDARHEAFARR